MLIDHIAWLFVSSFSVLGQSMHFIGRLTGATMAIFIAEGYNHTLNANKYTLRLGIFALISWPCFSLMEYDRIVPEFGVIYTLFLALLAIRVWDADIHISIKIVLIACLCLLSMYGDWAVYNILFALAAHIWKEDKKTRWIVHTAIVAIVCVQTQILFMSHGLPFWYNAHQYGLFLVAPMFVYLYNGESGSKAPFHKWFFYAFYPLHMLALWFVKYKL